MDREKIENRIAILVYLPDEVSSLVKKVKQENDVSYPNHETQIPHITIYSCRFNESRFPELVQRIQNIRLKPFSIKLGKVELANLHKGSQNPFVSLGLEEENSLRELHQKVLSVANELRGNLVREKDIDRFKKGIYTQELFSFIEKYGYEHVIENFHPHITLGEVERGDIQKIKRLQDSLAPLEGKELLINSISILLSTRRVPSEEKVKESEVVKVDLES